MKKETLKQIELLKKYNVSNYSIDKNEVITINGYLYLNSLTNADKDFLKGTTINGYLCLNSLTNADKDFLKGTTINGYLDLNSLTNADKDFLKGTTINSSLYLNSLTNADKDFLKGTTINGSLCLNSLTNADKDFLKGTTINGYLDLNSLTNADKDFLKGTTINGSLYLNSLTNADKDFLKGTTINGYLCLNSLTNTDKEILKNNITKLKRGFYQERNCCYFDGILTKVVSVKEVKDYIIYTTNIGFIAENGNYTAHGETVKKAIIDVEFKVIAEKLKKNPIMPDTKITIQYYRIVTGACEMGAKNFQQQHDLKDEYFAKDLLPILEKHKAYGIENFKKLINW
jgi:protein tyrosine/serine phosphatase